MNKIIGDFERIIPFPIWWIRIGITLLITTFLLVLVITGFVCLLNFSPNSIAIKAGFMLSQILGGLVMMVAVMYYQLMFSLNTKILDEESMEKYLKRVNFFKFYMSKNKWFYLGMIYLLALFVAGPMWIWGLFTTNYLLIAGSIVAYFYGIKFLFFIRKKYYSQIIGKQLDFPNEFKEELIAKYEFQVEDIHQ